jgi:hypothetical protein
VIGLIAVWLHQHSPKGKVTLNLIGDDAAALDFSAPDLKKEFVKQFSGLGIKKSGYTRSAPVRRSLTVSSIESQLAFPGDTGTRAEAELAAGELFNKLNRSDELSNEVRQLRNSKEIWVLIDFVQWERYGFVKKEWLFRPSYGSTDLTGKYLFSSRGECEKFRVSELGILGRIPFSNTFLSWSGKTSWCVKVF